jgi:hypothetical protein
MLRVRPIRLPQLGTNALKLRLSPIREIVSLAIRQRQEDEISLPVANILLQ